MGVVQDGVGHPTVLTPAREERYFEALRKGASHKAACYFAGWSLSTVQRWANDARAVMQKMEEEEERGVPLEERYQPTPLEDKMMALWNKRKEVEAEMEMKAVGHWVSFFDKDWKAAAAYLAVRFKDDWQPNRANAALPDGMPPDVAASLKAGGVSVQIYLPDNGRRAAAQLEDSQEVIEGEAFETEMAVDEPPTAEEV